MKVIHRGHEIDVKRTHCMAGWPQLYVSIFRVSDGYECASFCTEDASPVRTYVGLMKDRVDKELASEDPWNENASARPLGYMQQRGAA